MALSARVTGMRSAAFGAAAPLRAPAAAVRPALASRQQVTKPQALFGGLFGGSSKEADKSGGTTPQYFICVDCGYIYPDGEFKKAPGSYRCPVCNSPKSRFKVFKGVVRGKPNNSGAALKQRFQARQW